MKKRAKKLSLSRETLRHLEADRFRHVVAGSGNTNEIMTGCACTDSCNCGTDTGTGTGTNGCPGNTNEVLSGCATNCG
jgi:hypothetical protein